MEEPSIRMAAEDTAEAEGQTEAADDTAEVEQEVEMEVTEAAIGGGASRRQIWDQSRMFDPGILFGIFPNLIATNFKIWRAKELDIIWFSTVVK